MSKKHPGAGKEIACMTCHAPDPANNEAAKFTKGVHTIYQGGKTKLECSICHAL